MRVSPHIFDRFYSRVLSIASRSLRPRGELGGILALRMRELRRTEFRMKELRMRELRMREGVVLRGGKGEGNEVE